jgi:tight adherence protein B
MRSDGAALLLLACSLVLAFGGLVMLVRGASARAALADRGRMDTDGGGPGVLDALDRRMRRTRGGRRMSEWLKAAGANVRVVDLVALWAAGTFVAAMLLSGLLPPIVAWIAAVAAVTGVIRAWGERRRRQRRDEFIAQLPDLARVLSNGAAAGLSMAGAVRLAAREMPEPAREEMRTVVEQIAVGQPLDAALEALRDRLPSREVSVLMSTLIIQQRAGGDTVRALSELGTTLETRKDLQREIRTILSGAVFNSYIVAAMGAGTLLLVDGIQPGLLRKMASTAIGIAALAVAAVLWTIGFVAVRRITRVET